VSVQVFQPAANIRSRSLFRENFLTRRRFPDPEMSRQHLLPAKSQTPRQHLRSCPSGCPLSTCFYDSSGGCPWTISIGGCTFSGDYAGAPLVRTGTCPLSYFDGTGTCPTEVQVGCATEGGTLDLSSRGITSLQPDAFQGMTKIV
jgi:hypothetical protein